MKSVPSFSFRRLLEWLRDGHFRRNERRGWLKGIESKIVSIRSAKSRAARFVQLACETLEERVVPALQPDLTVVSATLGSSTAIVGNQDQLSVTWTVKNQGTFAPTQNWSDGFYLSSQTTYDSSAVFIGNVNRNDPLPLAIGGTYTSSTTLTIPNTTLLGNQNLLVVADNRDSINESSTTNNSYAVPVHLADPNVNLAVSNASVSSSQLVAGNGAAVTVSWTVTNTGADPAQNSWSDGVYLSSGTTVDDNAVYLYSFAAPKKLAPQASYTQSQIVTIPNTTLLGSNENILIQADAYSDQGQDSTANGTAVISHVSVAGPGNVDLEIVPGSVSAPSTATLGQTIPVSWTVKNIGTVAASTTWEDDVYSSPTATFNADTAHDLYLAVAPATLAPGASYTLTEDVPLGAASSGDSFLVVQTNFGNMQAESASANDFGSTAITLSEPSLAITSFNAPASANLGDTVTLTWGVKNTSSVATAAPWSDGVYLSDSATFNAQTAQLVASFPAPIAGSLAGGASYNQSEPITLPYAPTGSRFLLLVADIDSNVASFGEPDSQPVSGTTPIVASSVLALGEPDLVVALNSPPGAAVLGQAFDLSWTVTNEGGIAANASWQDAVFVSTSANFDPATAIQVASIDAPTSLAAGASYTIGTTVILPSLAAGNYHLFVVADRDNDQGKSNESIDNIATAPLSVTGPALTVQINSAPSSVVAGNGASAAVTWTVTNNSNVDAVDSWEDTVYLSTSQTLNLANAQTYWDLGDFGEPININFGEGVSQKSYLDAMTSYTNTQQVVIPNVPSTGTYFFIVVGDNSENGGYYGSGQPVTSTANAAASVAVAVSLPAVTLTVQSATPNPTSIATGTSFALSWIVKNTGTATTGSSWSDEVYLSSKQTLDSTAADLGNYYYYGQSSNPLAPNATYTATQTLTIPATTPAGTYYLLIEPDNSQSQAASTSVFAQAITVTVPDVKLATTITSSPASATVGQSVTVSWTVTNKGSATTTAPYWYDYIYLSTKPTYDSSALYLESYAASNGGAQLPLAHNASYNQSETFTFNPFDTGLVSGSYYLLVQAAGYGNQAQADASQSVASAPITVTSSSSSDVDLIVSTATAPATAAVGASIPVSFTVENQGTTATTASWTDAVYLSNSPTLNSFDTYVGQFTNVSALNGEGSYTNHQNITVPTSASAGSHYLIFDTNQGAGTYYGGGQAEVNTANDTFAVLITLGAPSLVPTALTVTGATVEGANVTVAWTVQNQGTAPATGTWNDGFYLSDTPTYDANTAISLESFTEPHNSPIAAQGAYSDSQSLTLPGTTTGSRYLLLVADASDVLGGEADRTNYVDAVPITLTAPNLAISNVTVSPQTAEIGAQGALTAAWTVTNTSNIATYESWTDTVYLSPTSVFNSNTATQVSSAPNPHALAAGASYTTTLTNLSVPNLAAGSYYLFVVANSNFAVNHYSYDAQPETDAGDNILAAVNPLVLSLPNVNLQVSNPTADNTGPADGQMVNVSFQVNNVGNATAQSAWDDGVYLSSSATYNSNTATYLDDLPSQSPLAAGSSYTQSTSFAIPDDQAPGTYYLFFVANFEHGLGEGQIETNYNDDVSAPLQITVNAPELSIAINTAPTTANLNDSVELAWTVTNISTQYAAYATWYDIVYLSSSPSFNPATADNLTVLDDENIYHYSSPLAAGGQYSEDDTVTIPNTTTGPQYLLFVTDAYDQQGQTTRVHDVAVQAITLSAPQVNLQVVPGSVSVTPTAAGANSYVSVSWSVENTGADPANGPWYDDIYLSHNSTFDSSAVELSSDYAPPDGTPLAAGDNYSNTDGYVDLYAYDASFTPGAYYLYVVANDDGGQSVTNTTDNVSAAIPFTILPPPAPDLQVTGVSVTPTAAIDGSSVSVTWTVQNTGTDPAVGTWDDKVFVSANPNMDNTAQFLGYFPETQNLAAGTGQYTDTETVSLANLGTTITGAAYILVEANGYGTLAEGNTNNNTGASSAIQLSAPALAVSAPSAPATGVIGGSIPVTWTVTNTSSVNAQVTWNDAIYISPDNELDDNAHFVTSFAAPTILAAHGAYTQTQNVTLPSTDTGPEFLLIVADQNNAQPQTGIGNIGVVPIDVSAADLTLVNPVVVPATALVAQPFGVTWTVKNIGTGPADEAWEDTVYYSTRNTFTNTAVYLTSIPTGSASPLAAGASYTHSAQVTLPAGLAAGTYYLYVVANANGGQLETNSNNDVSAGAAFMLIGADLTVPSANFPASATFGQAFTATWTVTNTGNSAATQSWTDGVYLSPHSTFDGSAFLLKDVPVGSNSPLAGSASYTQSAQVTVPLTLHSVTGTYYLYVVTNDDGQQPVTNETNNVSAAQQVSVALPTLANLRPSALSLPTSGFNGQRVIVSWLDTNSGTANAAGPWNDFIEFAGDAQGDNAFGVAEAAYPSSLAVGQQSVPLSQPIMLPSTPGTYYLVVVADGDGSVNEGPNAVNEITVDPTPITVTQTPLADLVVTTITPPMSVISGTTVPVTYTVKNEGNAPTNSALWLDGVFISQSANLTLSGDNFSDGFEIMTQPLGVPVFVNNPSYLEPGDSYSQTVNVPFPVSASGIWYVYVVTNRSFTHTPLDNFIDVGPVVESNSINDMTVSTPFSVTLAPVPDLTVAPVQTPPEAFSGQPLTVSWTVTNQGAAIAIGQAFHGGIGAPVAPYTPATVANSTWTDEVFMSPDATLDSNAVSLGIFTHAGALDPDTSYTNSQKVTLPVGVSGKFYFIVQTDIDGQVFESSPTGHEVNATPSAITVNLTPPPDLHTSILSAPASDLASHALSFTYQVSNVGAGATQMLQPDGIWTDTYYLSPTPAFHAGTAILLGTQTYDGTLAAGASYLYTITATLPNALNGSYYLIVDADSGNAIFELDQTGKFGTSALQITSKPADLVVSAASAPAAGQAGATVPITWTVTNQGIGDSAVTRWQDNVYADTGAGVTSNSVLLGSYMHTGLLAATASYSQTQLVTLAISLSGPFNLFVVTNEPIANSDGTLPAAPVYESNFGNDTSAALPINITQHLADLQVTAVTAPGSVQTAGSVTVHWTVFNNGVGVTNSNYWFDDVWISTNPTLASGGADDYLGSVQHSNPLAPGGSYSTALTVTVPADLTAGSYFFIVAADRPVLPSGAEPPTADLVYESNESNNEKAAAANVTPGPDLVVSSVTAPATVSVNQPLAVGWTVTNSGAGGTGDIPIQDSVYLSYDKLLSDSSIYVGSLAQRDGLAAGAAYTSNTSLDLPVGLEGTFYVFVVTDTNQNVFEANPNDAVAFDPTPLQIVPTPPADLVAGTVTIPANGAPGQNITISYQVTNNGVNPANGAWHDTLYLSPTPTWSVSDPILGTVDEDMDLAAGASYTGTLTAPLPGVNPGSYYVIVRTNILDTISETTLANNLSASLTQSSLTVPALTLGTPTAGTLGIDLSAYYEVTVPAGQTLQVNFTTNSVDSLNELYLSLGAVPTRDDADYQFTALAADQLVTVPTTQAGTYYILAYAASVPSGGSVENYTITAALVPFAVQAVTPNTTDNAGPTTLVIDGAQFDRGTTFHLVGPASQIVGSSAVAIQDAATAYVTFDLAGAAVGAYSVVATSSTGVQAQLSAGLNVQAGLGGVLSTSLTGPSEVLPGAIGIATEGFGNSGDGDVGAPLIFLQSDNGTYIGLTAAAVPYDHPPVFLAVSPTGPAGTLRPGEQLSQTVYFQASTTNGVANDVNDAIVDTTNTTPIDWTQIDTYWLASTWQQSSNWSAAFALLQQRVGPTWGTFVQLLDQNATLLPADAGDPSYVPDVVNVEVAHDVAAVNTSISGVVQATDLSIPISNVQVTATNTATGDVFVTNTYTNGSFVFDTVTPGTYTFAYQGAIVESMTPVTVANAQAVTGVTVPVSRGAVLTGVVTGAGTSTVIGGAIVTAVASDGASYPAATNSQGQYQIPGLPPDTYTLIVTATGEAQAYLPGVVVGATDVSQAVTMNPQGIVAGTLVLPTGSPSDPEFTITAEPAGATNPLQDIATETPAGAFTLGGLPAGTYTIVVQNDAFVTHLIENVVITQGQTTSLGSITLVLGASIAGNVASTSKAFTAADAAVEAFQGGNEVSQVDADSSGNFEFTGLPAGTYTIEVSPVIGFATSVSVTVQAGGQVTGVSLQVEPGGTISGQATDGVTGAALASIPVFLTQSDGTQAETVTDSNGQYQFAGLAPASYAVSLEIAGADAYQNVVVANANQTTTVNLQESYPESIQGVLVAGGAPVAEGTVVLYSGGQAIASVLSGADGSYTFLLTQPGTFDLQATANGPSFAAVTGLTVSAGQTVTQNFQSGDNSLQFTVQGSGQSSDTNNVIVSYEIAASEWVQVASATVTGNGSTTFTDLAPGSYEVAVYGPNNRAAITTTTVVEGTPDTAAASLAASGQITGTVADPNGNALAGAKVSLTKPSDSTFLQIAESASDGTFTLPYLADGTYDLVVLVDGYQAAVLTSLTVSGAAALNEPISLTPSTTQLTGSVLDPSGNPIATATVQVEDASGHVLGMAAVQPNGSFTITTATGTGLKLVAAATGYARATVSNLNVAAGATVNVGTIKPQAVADPDPFTDFVTSLVTDVSNMIAAQTNAWYAMVQSELERVQSEINNRNQDPLPPPDCPQCNAAYNAMIDAFNKQEQLAQTLQKIHDATDNLLTGYATAWVGDFEAIAAGLLSVYTPELAFLPIASKLPKFASVAVGLIPLFVNLGNGIISLVSSYNSLTSPADFSSAEGLLSKVDDLTQALLSDASAALSGVNAYLDLPALLNLKNVSAGDLEAFGAIGNLGTIVTLLGGGLTALDHITGKTSLAQDAGNQLNAGEQALQGTETQFILAQKAYVRAYFAYAACNAAATCNDPKGKPLYGPWPPLHNINPPSDPPHDPNNIIGPAGFGAENFVAGSQVLPYTIDFENDPTAGLPAQQVTITEQLDPGLNAQSFRLGSFGFGGATYTVPADTAFYQTQIDLTQTNGYFVDVAGTIDERTDLATWTFTTIDPATGEIPLDPSVGFLPPDNANGIGAGFVSYTVLANQADPTGTVINAQATVLFYTQPPINTPLIFNTLDSGSGLSSAVTTLPVFESSATFNVAWSGLGNAAGSAVAGYSIYVSDNGGAYAPFLIDTTNTSATFTGQSGHTYSFYSIAFDNAGNAQATPSTAQTATTVRATPIIAWSNPADLTYGTPLSSAQLDATVTAVVDGATVSVPGAFSYTLADGVTPAIGAVLQAGQNQVLNVTFTPSDPSEFFSATGQAAINVDPKSLTVSLIGDPAKTYDGTTTAILTPTNFQFSGLVGTQSFVVTQTAGTYDSKDTNAATVSVTLSPSDFSAGAGTLAGDYTLPTSVSGAGIISAQTLTVSIIGTPAKVYDGASAATLTPANFQVTGLVGSDNFAVTQTAGVFDSKDTNAATVSVILSANDFAAGTGTLANDYSLPTTASGAGTIAPRTLTATILGDPTKTYDGATAAILTPANFQLTGLAAGESFAVTRTAGTYNSKDTNAATVMATLSANDFTAGAGTLASDYTLPTNAAGAGTILAKTLTAAIVGAPTKSYDGATSAILTPANFQLTGLVGSESLAVTQTAGVYNSKDTNAATVSAALSANNFTVGAGTLTSDYVLPMSASGAGSISAQTLTASIIGDPTKIYDGTAAAILTPSNFQIAGLAIGESFTVTQPAGVYDSKDTNAATVSATLSANDFTAGTGTLVSDYSFPATASGAGTISPKTLTASLVADPTKTYDGTTTALLTPTNFQLTGLIGSENLTVTQTAGAYNSKDTNAAAVSATLSASDFSAGPGALRSDYLLPSSAGGAGSISPKTLTAAIVADPTKVYDGTTAAILTPTNFQIAGLAAGESFTVTQTAGTYNSQDTDAATVSASLSASDFTTGAGTLTSDYTLPTTASGPGTITPLSQSIAFTIASPVTYGAAPIALTATGGASGNAVTFSVVSGPASLALSTLTITGVGTIVVQADQAGSLDYSAAPAVQSNLVVAPTYTYPVSEAANATPTAVPISTFLKTHFSDADKTTKPGIAITSVSGAGVWQYLSGTAWTNITAVSVNNALLLPQADKLRFEPAGLDTGTADLLFDAWDGSLGTSSGRANVSVRGGGTPFSIGAGLLTVAVTPVVAAPVWLATSTTLAPVLPGNNSNPAGQTVQQAFGALFSADGSQPPGVAVIGPIATAAQGAWQFALASNPTHWLPLGKVSSSVALLLGAEDLIRFVPSATFLGIVTLQVRAWDGAANDGTTTNLSKSTSFGGKTDFSSAILTAKLDVNHAPTQNATTGIALAATAENVTSKTVTVSSLLKDTQASDDKGTSLGLALTSAAGPGAWQYLIPGGAWQTVPATASPSSALLLPATALLRFVPTANQSGAATLGWCAWDGTQGTAGTQGFAITGTGGATAFSSNSASAALSVTASATPPAPTWSGTGATLTPVVPNMTPTGDTVANVFGSYFESPGSVGIAVSGVTGTTNGVWEFSSDGGSSWTSLNSVSSSKAILLSANDLIRFRPTKATFLGTATLTAHAWAANPAQDGTVVNLTLKGKTGGTTAISITTLTATCLVNDAPTLAS